MLIGSGTVVTNRCAREGLRYTPGGLSASRNRPKRHQQRPRAQRNRGRGPKPLPEWKRDSRKCQEKHRTPEAGARGSGERGEAVGPAGALPANGSVAL